MDLARHLSLAAGILSLLVSAASPAQPPERAGAERLGADLTPLGAEKAGNAAGTIPAWTGGYQVPRPPPGRERLPEEYEPYYSDKPQFVITAENMAEYDELLTPGQKALLRKFPDTYKMPVYVSRRGGLAPDFVYEATKKNVATAWLANDGESLMGASTGIPFPLPASGKEVIWNHKLRYRGTTLRRFNVQLAVQSNGQFTPFVLREDVNFRYNDPEMTPEKLENVGIYFLQLTVSPPRQSGNVLLVHETLDQVLEPRRAWLYNAGQRRVRRAPNVAYDNPGNGADGLRTNDQLDMFNGATDRYTWKLVGKREMIMPYSAIRLADNRLKYGDIAGRRHLNQDLTRYELHRVWVVEAELKEGTSHLYKRRTFYIDEDTWSILAVDCYDNRDELWRVQEAHSITVVWNQSVGPAASTVYDLTANRYLVMDLSNEEDLVDTEVDFSDRHFTTGNISRFATR